MQLAFFSIQTEHGTTERESELELIKGVGRGRRPLIKTCDAPNDTGPVSTL